MRRDVVLVPLYLWVSASILLHVVSNIGLTEVGDRARRESEREARRVALLAHSARPPVEIDYIPAPPPPPVVAVNPPPRAPSSDPTRPTDPTHAPTPPATPHARPPTPPRPLVARRAPPPTPVRPPTPTPQHRPAPRLAAAHAATPPPPPPRAQALPRMQHVDQQNNTNEPRPTDPAFLAQSNHDVREQTVAQLRNLDHNAVSPQLGGTPADHHADHEGNGAHDVSADDRERHGDTNANPALSATPSPRAASTPRLAAAATPGAGAPSSAGGAARAQGREGHEGRAGEAGQQGASGPNAQSSADGTVHNAMTEAEGAGGTISVGEGNGGGQSGTGGQQGQGGHDGHDGQLGRAAVRMGVAGVGAAGALAMLTPSQTNYQEAFGTRVENERAVAQLRRSQARGNYTDSWRENRAAIENFTPSVHVGNQTSLRTAQSPFSAYLTAMHRRIHRHYADGFLAGLESAPANSPLNDTSLVTTIEIILEHDGRIHRIGVVRTSGFMPFDVAALNSVRRAAPFGEAPAQILSGDGRVYMHWGFYRNERECGTFNVDPYILPNPGSTDPHDREPVPVPHTPGPDRVGAANAPGTSPTVASR